MEIISVNWDVSVSSGNKEIELEEMNVDSMEEWEALSKDEQRNRIQTALDEMSEQPYMIVGNWSNE